MLNSITMVGRLTRDPELRTIPSTGNSVASFTIACDDSRKGPNGERQTVFISCSLFGKPAESFCRFTKKGNLVGVVGRLVQRKYTNRDGQQVTTTEIACDRAEFMEPKSNNGDVASSGYVADAPAPSMPAPQVQTSKGNNLDSFDIVDEDLPF